MPNPVHITCGMILRYGSNSRVGGGKASFAEKLPFGDNFSLKTKGIFESRISPNRQKRKGKGDYVVRKLDLGMEVFRKVRDFFCLQVACWVPKMLGHLRKSHFAIRVAPKTPQGLAGTGPAKWCRGETYPTAKELPEMFTWNHPTLSLVGFGWLISGANIYIYTFLVAKKVNPLPPPPPLLGSSYSSYGSVDDHQLILLNLRWIDILLMDVDG